MTRDLLFFTDTDNINILILLDLSVAFNTINHSTLLTCLESTFIIMALPLLVQILPPLPPLHSVHAFPWSHNLLSWTTV